MVYLCMVNGQKRIPVPEREENVASQERKNKKVNDGGLKVGCGKNKKKSSKEEKRKT